MPVYEFICEKCGEKMVEFYKDIKDATSTVPCNIFGCGGIAKKIISKVGPPKFVGNGFYETDYKK